MSVKSKGPGLMSNRVQGPRTGSHVPGKQITAERRRGARRWQHPGPSAVYLRLTADGQPLTKRAQRRAAA